MTYAEDTKVSVERSESELKALLRRHKADRIATGYDDRMGLAVVNFAIGEGPSVRMVRLEVRVPSLDSLVADARKDPPHGWNSWSATKRGDYCKKRRDQIERQRWRALLLVTKAKLELIEQGLSSLEREFLADLVLPGGGTVSEMALPAIAEAYLTGKMPPLLPGVSQ